uniref:RNA helicase n=1 Tax=Lygus hesperus TaxID=30085 RepID=A0A0A9W9Q9_LYGHE
MESESDPRYPQLKVEMKTLTLSDQSTKMILETLKNLHGAEFTHKDQSAYKDNGRKLDRQYWTDRGNLVIQGRIDYSSSRESSGATQEMTQFALEKLEKYGFHQNHCREALRITSGDMGGAYELLMSKYFNFDLFKPTNVDPNLLEERSQELESIRSIYEHCCDEKIPKQLWIIHLDLPYLADLYLEKPRNRRDQDDQREVCRFFLRGRCRFSRTCKWSHVRVPRTGFEHIPVDETRDKFDLEIRFPLGCKYPLEPAIVSLTAVSKEFPASAALRVSRLLMEESKKCAAQEQPCVFVLVDLLKNSQDEIVAELKRPCPPLYDPDRSLLPQGMNGESIDEPEGDESDHMYSEGTGPKKQLIHTDSSIDRIDTKLAEDFKKKPQSRQYSDMLNFRRELPAYQKMRDIIEIVRANQVTIISGETGCGKSTQVPQFLLDDWLLNRVNEHVEIICTQPRKISAIGVAERVAAERAERVGESVGYQVRLENRTSARTRLMFCTTGILLRRLEGDPKLSSISHVVVDEVHERSSESDFLLLVLKDLLPVRTDLKILLMSATLNSELFLDYFPGSPVIEIPGRTFPVDQIFLEDAVHMSKFILEEYSPTAKRLGKQHSRELEMAMEAEDMTNLPIKGIMYPHPKTPDEHLPIKQLFYRYKDYCPETAKAMFLIDSERIDNDLIEHILNFIVEGDHKYPRIGSILVFCPAWER